MVRVCLKLNNMKIKVITIFILNLIKKNPIKLIALAIAIITFPFLNSIPDSTKETPIIKEIKIDGDYVYISRDIISGEIKYDISTFNKKQKMRSNIYLIEKEYQDGNILIWILFLVTIGFFVFGSIIKDDDVNWNFKHISQKTIAYFIICEEEDGIYYYLYDDRLITKSKNMIQVYDNIAYSLKVYNFAQLRSYPIWNSKQKKRNSKLDQLGIEE
jgi:hypothetical protein